MKAIIEQIHEWILSTGVNPAWSKPAAFGLCAFAVVCAAGAFCAILGASLNRIFSTRSVSQPHKENRATLIRTASWFIFTWILSSYLPDALSAFRGFAVPVSRILDMAAVMLCAATLSSGFTCLHSAAKRAK